MPRSGEFLISVALWALAVCLLALLGVQIWAVGLGHGFVSDYDDLLLAIWLTSPFSGYLIAKRVWKHFYRS